jgi:pimeloyl-ACP methyl ester carboxylesterase
MRLVVSALAGLVLMAAAVSADERRSEGFVNSSGVKLHYVCEGEGPLVILLHGFPDYWYTWRDQMPALARHFQVVAVDLRGYNKSDQPEGAENYALEKLTADVAAVVEHFGQKQATIVGHDWGGAIAWGFAMLRPEMTSRLVILNLPHPRGLLRELANNPAQQKNSQYARDFQQPEAAKRLTPELLAFWVKEPEARQEYIEAFKRSSIEGMLNYYKANYPRPPYAVEQQFPPVKCPVLMIHGLKDQFLLPGALDGTWNWVEGELTLVTIPQAGHFVHRDAPERVTSALLGWLTRAQ